MFHTNVKGELKQLFPNAYVISHKVEADKVQAIPSEDMEFEFVIIPPFGAEVVKAIATLQPIEDIETTPTGEVF